MPHSVASLDSVSVSSDGSHDFDDDELLIAEQEWRESLGQLQQVFAVVFLPIFGRWLGRKWSFWAYARYLRLGLNSAFFFGERSPTPSH
ncbi:hypothetical protein POSPLADRAFT_1176160 [Postia placenta MAD-698-R-SB12]|uniref:Uncharacterized protein n=1 Tax=Postia placenta MAD-698-R-SB12 TaxID=670580 RepID=A0A1X6NFH2_9APHY|nr:hypothetical protein POSPLADRAFT_1176160 [Postia placenta MAD-698-R-SB12]OSX67364.1 hypothetical protein POSPLADRAFT_1176160 [Postia placenta MAD-698-R-SB12]